MTTCRARRADPGVQRSRARLPQVVDGLRAARRSHVLVVDDGSTDATGGAGARGGRRGAAAAAQLGQGTRGPRRAGARSLRGTFTHVLLLDGDMQHLPARSRAAARRGRAHRRRRGARRARSSAARRCRRRATTRTGSAAGRCRGSSASPLRDTQCGFRVFRVDALRGLPLRGARLRHRNRDAGQAAAARRADRQRADLGGLRRAAQQAAAGARHHPHLFPGGVLSLHRTPLTCGSSRHRRRRQTRRRDRAVLPRRWTLHGLNNGTDLRRDLPRRAAAAAAGVVRDRPRRHLARLAADGRDPARRSPTISRALFPDESPAGARAPRARHAAEPTPATSSIFCARCARPPEQAADAVRPAARRTCELFQRLLARAARHRSSSPATTATGRSAAC